MPLSVNSDQRIVHLCVEEAASSSLNGLPRSIHQLGLHTDHDSALPQSIHSRTTEKETLHRNSTAA